MLLGCSLDNQHSVQYSASYESSAEQQIRANRIASQYRACMCNYIQFILLIQVLENSILFVGIKRKVSAHIRKKEYQWQKQDCVV